MTEEAPPDRDLLRRYRTSGCGESFRALVQRHAGMVCATAQRILGNDLWAQDVMQAVFVDFARKARALPDGIVPGAWLYRAACRHALNRQRTEARHRRRMEAHAVMNEPATADETWAALSPHIDAALASLNATDRTALVLRFLENQPLADVGQAMGTTADTAQKRVSRALTKLRALLLKRGVTLSAAVLGSQALRESVQAAAPVVAWEPVAASALSAGTAAPSLWTVLTCNARAALIAAGISSLAGGVVWQTARAAGKSPEASQAAAAAASARDGTPGRSRLVRGSRFSGPLLPEWREPATAQEALEMMQDILSRPDNYHRQALVSWMMQQDLLTKLPLVELAQLMEQCGSREVMAVFGPQVLSLCQFDGPAAAGEATRIAIRQPYFWALSAAADCFAGWAGRDAAAAYEWLAATPIENVQRRSLDGIRPAWVVLACSRVEDELKWNHGDMSRAIQFTSAIPRQLRAPLFQHELTLENRYSFDAPKQVAEDLTKAGGIADPALREWFQRSIIRAAMASAAKWQRDVDKLHQALSAFDLPDSAVPDVRAMLTAKREFDPRVASRLLEEAPDGEKREALLEATRAVIQDKFNTPGWSGDLNEWLSSLPPETPGLDQAKLILQRRRAQNNPFHLFKHPLPVTDPEYHDAAVAGWLQLAADNNDSERLRSLYEQSKIARDWSPELRARVEEIISTAKP